MTTWLTLHPHSNNPHLRVPSPLPPNEYPMPFDPNTSRSLHHSSISSCLIITYHPSSLKSREMIFTPSPQTQLFTNPHCQITQFLSYSHQHSPLSLSSFPSSSTSNLVYQGHWTNSNVTKAGLMLLEKSISSHHCSPLPVFFSGIIIVYNSQMSGCYPRPSRLSIWNCILTCPLIQTVSWYKNHRMTG
jgi:hypothetical protein